jgi:hypothetical protein
VRCGRTGGRLQEPLRLAHPFVRRRDLDARPFRRAAGEGSHEGHHHFIARGLVAEVEGDKVRLSANADVALTFEEEEGGDAI